MDIRQMNRTHLDHWRGLRKQLWPGHQALGFEETERVIFYRKRC